MYKEELYEEGIVKESKNGIAEIVISDSNHCQECSAKVYCKPSSSNERNLTVKEPFGVHPGDKVKVSIKGNEILKVSFFIYGVPLVLILAGLFLGMQFFETNKELFSTLTAFGLVSIYIVICLLFDKRKSNKIRAYPTIIIVNTKNHQA